tara:strand:+ start:989 stop:3772 length:2784 start_codon:yes stop_codon:yes gene_type:complete
MHKACGSIIACLLLFVIAPLPAQSVLLDLGPEASTGSVEGFKSPAQQFSSASVGEVWNFVEPTSSGAPLSGSKGETLGELVLTYGVETSSDSQIIDFTETPNGSSALGAAAGAGVYPSGGPSVDGVFHTVGSDSRGVGLRIDGLAAGRYEIYLTGKNTNASTAMAMRLYAAAGTTDSSFYFGSSSSVEVGNALVSRWLGAKNFGRFEVDLTAGESLYLVAAGVGSGLEGRGFLNTAEIIRMDESHARRPNILFIFADDLGYETVGALGGLDFETPEIDSLGESGLLFSRAYTSPVCTPSRVSLHTGTYTSQHTVDDVLPVHYGTTDYVDFISMPTFAQILRDSGYRTSTTGKWQLATLTVRPDHIRDSGFDSWCVWQIWDGSAKTTRYWNPYFNRDGQVLSGISDRFGPDVLHEYVIERMHTAQEEDRPFLIVHNMLLPHVPIVQTPDDIGAGRNGSLKEMVSYLDKLVGELFEEAEFMDPERETFVIFMGDNGTESSSNRTTTAGTVSGGKRDLDDAGTHVPMVVWSSHLSERGRVIDTLTDITDIFPTFCQLAGIDLEEVHSVPGYSLVPQIRGRPGAVRLWTHQGISGKTSVFDGTWRLSSNMSLYGSPSLPNETLIDESDADYADHANRLEPLLDGDPNTGGATSDALVLDDASASGVTIIGDWKASSAVAGYYGSSYLHDQDSGKGEKLVAFEFTAQSAGDYAFDLRWVADENRANNTPVTVVTDSGSTTYSINQRINGNAWNTIAIADLSAGEVVSMEISNLGTNGYVCVDAARLISMVERSDYDVWSQLVFPASIREDSGMESTVWGDFADPDQDGIPNRLEYLLGKSPLTQDTLFQDAQFYREEGEVVFSYLDDSEGTEGGLTMKVSTDLLNWDPIEERLEVLSRYRIDSRLRENTVSLEGDGSIRYFFRYDYSDAEVD